LGTNATTRLGVAVLLCLAGAILSSLLLFQHHGEDQAVAAVNQVCGDGTTSGCETVARSPDSALAGVPLAAVGLFFYVSLALLLVPAALCPPESRDPFAGLAFTLLALALLADLGLLGVQAFLVKAFCKLCLATYALNAAALAALLPAWRSARALGAALGRPEGRLTAVGWALGSFIAAGGTFAADRALKAREAERAATLFGRPAASAPTAPAAATPVGAATPPASIPADPEARKYQEQARRLQETLDDPQKLEQYFAAKAAREFDQAPVQSLDLTDVPFKGPAGAPIQVVEYSDFMCPYCRALAGFFINFLGQSGNRVVVYYKNFPLDQACNPKLKASTHPGACWLALGAICAQYQGHFWPYHDRVFSNELHNPQPADVARLGTEAGLNGAALEGCVADPRTKERLTAQIEEAQRLGIQATPTVFVDGKKLPRLNDLVQVLDKEAQRKGLPPLPPPSAH
jgi:protein-disulfide isomerase/uncharacterized membrane protein